MSDLIQLICIDDGEVNDKEWGSLNPNDLTIRKNNTYWGSYSFPTQKILRPSYFIYENYDKDSLIGVFDATRFITLAEWRNQQIDSILDE